MPSENTGKRACRDHLGHVYPDKSAMARAWGISPSTLDSRLRRGTDLKTALTKRTGEGHRSKKPCRDHLGNEYPSITDMCTHYGLKPEAYTRRIKLGWTLERTLTQPENMNRIVDHEGNEHESVAHMCRFWDIPRGVYDAKRRQGVPMDQILDPNRRKGNHPCSDGHGRDFPTIAAMRSYWFNQKLTGSETVDLEALYDPDSKSMTTLPDYGIEVIKKLGSYRMIRYQEHTHVMTIQGLHRLVCREALRKLGVQADVLDPEDIWYGYVCRKHDGKNGVLSSKKYQAAMDWLKQITGDTT